MERILPGQGLKLRRKAQAPSSRERYKRGGKTGEGFYSSPGGFTELKGERVLRGGEVEQTSYNISEKTAGESR